MADDPSQPAPPTPPPRPGPTRLELARELEALRLAVREREAWIAELRRELEERDASLGWRDQEARTSAAEAAAARREALQYREDRDHARQQLHLRAQELEASLGLVRKLEAEVRDLRVERRRRQEELIGLRQRHEDSGDAPAEVSSDGPVTAAGNAPSTGSGDAVTTRGLEAQREREALEQDLRSARAQLSRTQDSLTALADELVALQETVQGHAADATAARVREIELLQRLTAQADELSQQRAELDRLHAILDARTYQR